MKVVILPDPDSRNKAFMAGNTQFSVAVAADYVKQASDGYPISIIMTLNTVDMGTVIIIKDKFKDLSELKGRIVACEVDCMDYFVLKKALGEYGLTTEDVTVIDMAPYEGIAAFRKGTVDAVVTWPFENITEVTKTAEGEVVIHTRDFPGKVAMHARNTPGIYTNCISVQNKLLKEKPGAVVKVLRGYFRALRWCEEHEDEWCEIANEKLFYRNHQTTEDLIRSQSLVKYLKPGEIKADMKDGGLLYQECQKILDFYYDQGMIDSKPDPTSFINNELYLEAIEAYYEQRHYKILNQFCGVICPGWAALPGCGNVFNACVPWVQACDWMCITDILHATGEFVLGLLGG
jgi:ABC-type nitrate/sulfonate/bicarbonate transport system substrate-binding protein